MCIHIHVYIYMILNIYWMYMMYIVMIPQYTHQLTIFPYFMAKENAYIYGRQETTMAAKRKTFSMAGHEVLISL